jgi:hypothetical protein
MMLLVLSLSTMGVASEYPNGPGAAPLDVAPPGVTCSDVLGKCDAALTARKRQVEKLQLGLTQQSQRVADLYAQVEEKNAQLQSPLRNPFVMGAIGALIGIAVTGYALR